MEDAACFLTTPAATGCHQPSTWTSADAAATAATIKASSDFSKNSTAIYHPAFLVATLMRFWMRPLITFAARAMAVFTAGPRPPIKAAEI